MIIIVSGIPRSGTSMMMQMLKAGGVHLLTDHKRKADDDNPMGYFEFEKVKQLKRDASWLDHAEGKAVKVITQLLPDLPAGRTYKLILMDRDLDEALASQGDMLRRRGEQPAPSDPAKLKPAFEAHFAQTRAWLKQQANFNVLEVNYADVLRDPRAQAEAVARFLGLPLNVGAMAQSVDPRLHRHVKNEPAA